MNGPAPIGFDMTVFLATMGFAEQADLDPVPARFRDAMARYLRNGELPEDSLRRVLEGDLLAVAVFSRDDLVDLQTLIRWLRDWLPAACWGSRDQVQLWVSCVRRRVASGAPEARADDRKQDDREAVRRRMGGRAA